MLGYHVCCRLAELGHELAVYDLLDGWDFNERYLEEIPDVLTTYKSPRLFRQVLHTFKPDCVIHCAEFNSPDISMAEHMAYNVGVTTEIVHACAEAGVRCVVPAWSEFKHGFKKSFLGRTLLWRSQITDKFNIGNGINSTVFLPRIISPFMMFQFGGLVNPVYNSLLEGKPLILYEDENCSEMLTYHQWCSATVAADHVVQMAIRKTRNDGHLEGPIAHPRCIVAYVAMRLGLDVVEVHDDAGRDVYELRFSDYPEINDRIFKPIKQMIDEVIDVWERE